MAESEEEQKRLLMKVKEESERASLKLNIQKIKIIVSGPITSWQIDGKTVETVTDFILRGSKITADGDCSPFEDCHEQQNYMHFLCHERSELGFGAEKKGGSRSSVQQKRSFLNSGKCSTHLSELSSTSSTQVERGKLFLRHFDK